jgi:hypothetical protein
MERFFTEELSGMELRHFLNHVAKCNKCLDYIIETKNIMKEEAPKEELVI